MQMPIKTVGVILFRDDQVLLVCHGEKASHKNGVYGLPAGRIEEGENSKQAAVRELREESDLITEERFLLKVPELYTAAIERKDGVKHFSQENHVCEYWSGEVKPNLETIPEWVAIDDLGKKNLLPNVERMVRDAWEFYQNR